MKKKDWKELEALDEAYQRSQLSDQGKESRQLLLKKTEDADEHPEWYENACFCKLCCSYGD